MSILVKVNVLSGLCWVPTGPLNTDGDLPVCFLLNTLTLFVFTVGASEHTQVLPVLYVLIFKCWGFMWPWWRWKYLHNINLPVDLCVFLRVLWFFCSLGQEINRLLAKVDSQRQMTCEENDSWLNLYLIFSCRSRTLVNTSLKPIKI